MPQLYDDPCRFVARQGEAATLVSRIVGLDGAYITTSTVSAITWKCFDLFVRPYVVSSSGTLTIGSVVFNTLQTDGLLPLDSTGYNFKWTTPQTIFPNANAGQSYLVEVLFTTSLGKFTARWLATSVKPILSSPL